MTRTVQVIGAPTDYGTDRRGVDMGPSAIRYAGLVETLEGFGLSCRDAGDLIVPPADTAISASGPYGDNAKHLKEIQEVSLRLSNEVADTIEDGALPLVLGGDHSIAIGTMHGAARETEMGVLWFDAHGDFNTPETTPSGNVHGMPVAAALGKGPFERMDWTRAAGVREENVVFVGLRSLDEAERVAIRESDVTAYTMTDIDARGITEITEEAIEVATDGVEQIHVSIDLDWLDPNAAPGVGTPVRGGVTYREAHAALERVATRNRQAGYDLLRSLEVVEVNPILDNHNETAELACELAGSVLGKRIL